MASYAQEIELSGTRTCEAIFRLPMQETVVRARKWGKQKQPHGALDATSTLTQLLHVDFARTRARTHTHCTPTQTHTDALWHSTRRIYPYLPSAFTHTQRIHTCSQAFTHSHTHTHTCIHYVYIELPIRRSFSSISELARD